MSIVIFGTINELVTPEGGDVVNRFIQLALTMTFLAGLFQFSLGLGRMGALVNFVSHTVVVSFTAGAAILIATSQLKNVFGVTIPSSESFLDTWVALIYALPTANGYAFGIAMITLITVILFKKYLPRWPGMLIAMIVGGLITLFLNTPTIKMVPAIPATLPPLSSLDLSLTTIRQLAGGALAVALLGLVEAASISRSVATRSHQIISGNQEFIGQGLSNIIGPFFSGYATSGSFTRTGVNYEAGTKTPLSTIFTAIFLALIVLLVAPLVKYIPIPSMAGILLLVSYNLIDFHHIKAIIRTSYSETAVLLVTFLSTLFLALEFAIYVGVMLSLAIYLNRTSKPKFVNMVPNPTDPKRRLVNATRYELPEYPEVKIIRIDGSLFFGAVNYVAKRLQEIETPHLLIIGEGINFIDIAGAEMLVLEAERRRQLGGGLYFAAVKENALKKLYKGNYIKAIGEENIFTSRTDAIKTIFRLQNKECKHLL
jgi:SulP family sulfate permease